MSPRDARNFLRLDLGMPEHPKVEVLSDAAFRLLIETWCWCGRTMNDGQLSTASWEKRGTAKSRRELVAAGLVHEVEGGVQMHDYTKHQRSRAEVEAFQQKQTANGSKGGRPRKNPPRTQPKPSGFSVGSGSVTSPQNQEVEVEEEEEQNPSSLTVVCRLTSSNPRATTTTMARDVARWEGIVGTRAELDHQAERFLARNGEAGARLEDPGAAWLGWLDRAAEHRGTKSPSRPACPDCTDGWRGEDPDTGRPVRCETCRPLRAVEAS